MLLYEEETGNIIRACMNVFNELGNGFLEAVYQEALAIEFDLMNIPFAVGLLVNFGESSLKWERLTLLKNSEGR